MYIQPFQAWLQEKGKGELTLQEYLRVVKILARWWETSTGKPFDPDQVTARDLHDWIGHMQTVVRLAPSTINKRIAAMKTYWSFLTQAGHFTLNPTDPVRIRRASSL
ncbi:hypothetical protein GCM10011571_25420 [Marinithermofilum abyssi]|uniref:Core-binding (CB) domain-containing protein n=1 Tax=Marinithermofilum abyssi TaxID=1571185 RepID=A0A8J2VGW7_9BACL|nr:site-specific integrase [Marinithermofilum abyssi]GGE22263.1 hypothetical protein GCM10011571_25420 [Marinithermofilum abyssi]